jgi:hypothetical protein
MWHRQRDGARGMMPTRIPGSGRRIECSKSVWLLAFLAVLSATGMPGGAGAQTATAEPLELVRSFYVADFDQDAMPLSRRLETLRARAEEVSMQFGAPMAGLLHDWTLGPVDPDNPPGDGWQETVRVVESGRGKDRVTVVATFIAQSDGRDREEVRYLLLREGGRWVVDDIHYQAGGETLSALLEAGARGERN